MDAKPFLVLDLLDIDDTLIPEVQKLSKDSFDLESIISAAEELKYVGALKREIAGHSASRATNGSSSSLSAYNRVSYTARVREQFTALVRKASRQFLTESVNDRLKTALGAGAGIAIPTAEPAVVSSEPVAQDDLNRDTEIETTLEELEGYQIVKAIACGETKPSESRTATRRATSPCSSTRQQPQADRSIALQWAPEVPRIARREQGETRHPIDELDEIYVYANSIREAVVRYR